MDFSMCHAIKTNNISPLFSPAFPPKQPLQKMSPKRGFMKMGCAKQSNASNLVVNMERELEEIEKKGKIENWREMENCKGRIMSRGGNMVELLECLEKEAIMGDDEGREPIDYNRRAQIFDKSSKVFQALKELRSQTKT